MALDPLDLPAGSLRHSITIQAPSSTRDASGQPSQTWTPILTTRAAIRALSAREQVQNNQIAAQSTHEIKIRWPGSAVRLVTGQRIVFGTTCFWIQDIDNILERNRVVRLTCLTVDSASV
jgi:SPP1 family predicted phage head-tail adaptor